MIYLLIAAPFVITALGITVTAIAAFVMWLLSPLLKKWPF
jgi:hypothetical protein